MILTPCAAFADTANVALMLTVEPAPLDFTVTDSLSMHATQGQSDLTIDPCVITNTGSEDLRLSKVEITAASGWTVANASTDFTTAGSKNKIAFTAGGHDFADGAYAPGETIAAGSSTTLQLAGKISEKADLTNATQVASMVLTVEKVEIISFTIGSTSYQAEENMTWGEWVESSYNTASCTKESDIYIYYPLGSTPGWIFKGSTSNRVLVTDEIIAGTNYLVERSPHSGGSN